MAAAGGTQTMLGQLLQLHGVQVELDEAVAEYIANALDDFSPEEMVEVLASFVPEVGEALAYEQQVQLLTQLMRMREESEAQASGEMGSSEGNGSTKEELQEGAEGEEASDDNVEGSSASSSVSSPSNDENDPLAEDVQFLLGLVPEVGAHAARYVLQVISAGSRTHAAQYLVENSSPEGIERLKAEQVRLPFPIVRENDVATGTVLDGIACGSTRKPTTANKRGDARRRKRRRGC